MHTIGRPGKKKHVPCLRIELPGSFMHIAPVGALCEGSMRIKLRSELYANGALWGSTMHRCSIPMLDCAT